MRFVIKYSFVVLFSALCPIVIMLISDQMNRIVAHSLYCASDSLNSLRRSFGPNKEKKHEKKSFADIIIGETARASGAAVLWTSLLNVNKYYCIYIYIYMHDVYMHDVYTVYALCMYIICSNFLLPSDGAPPRICICVTCNINSGADHRGVLHPLRYCGRIRSAPRLHLARRKQQQQQQQ